MVELIVTDFDQISLLDWMLANNKIEYSVKKETTDVGLEVPYLRVDGVPIGFNASMKWIKERSNNEQN